MQYEEFLSCVQEQVTRQTADLYGEEGACRVLLNHVTKNNGVELDCISIVRQPNQMVPTIYLNPYYEQFRNGRSMEGIVREVIQLHCARNGKVCFSTEFFTDFENVRDRVVYRVIHYQENQEMLLKMPFKRILDLAIVFYLLLETGDDCMGNATVQISKSHLQLWKVDEDTIFEQALCNTPRLLPAQIRPMKEAMGELLNMGDVAELGTEPEMYILTNAVGMNGACCMLYDSVLMDFAAEQDSDLLIIPSSVHEVLLLPYSEEVDIQALNELVREVNETVVSAEEILADKVYLFRREDAVITFCV